MSYNLEWTFLAKYLKSLFFIYIIFRCYSFIIPYLLALECFIMRLYFSDLRYVISLNPACSQIRQPSLRRRAFLFFFLFLLLKDSLTSIYTGGSNDDQTCWKIRSVLVLDFMCLFFKRNFYAMSNMLPLSSSF